MPAGPRILLDNAFYHIIARANQKQRIFKNEDDFRQINLALENYNKSDVVKKGFIKSGGNWFENWKDYLDYKNVSEIQKEKDKKQIEEQRNMLNEAQKEGVPMPENVRQQVRETLEKLKKKSK